MEDTARRIEKGWRVATVALMVTTAVQLGGWIYWFSGWKSSTDTAIHLQNRRLERVERIVDQIPSSMQRMAIQQRLLIEGINVLIIKEGGSPVTVIPEENGRG